MKSRLIAYLALMSLVVMPVSGRATALVELDIDAQTPSKPQTPTPTTPTTPSKPSPPSSPGKPGPDAGTPGPGAGTPGVSGKEMKLTGCVQAGTSASSFELTNVTRGMAGSGTAPAASSSSDPSSRNVKLTAPSGVDLAAQVGHTIEVSGSWARSGDSASPASSSTSANSSSGGREFVVKNIKMVSSTCSAGSY